MHALTKFHAQFADVIFLRFISYLHVSCFVICMIVWLTYY